MAVMNNKIKINDMEADALLGILMLLHERNIRKNKEEGYKYKTSAQLKMLNTVFQITKYPSSETRICLAALLKISARSVQIWFQNMRQVIKDEVNLHSEKESTFFNLYSFNSASTQKHGKYISYEISTKKLIEIYVCIFEKKNNCRN